MVFHTFDVKHSIPKAGDNVWMTLLCDRISEALKETRMSQAELARRVGVTRATVGDWAKGRTKEIKGESLLKAAAALGVTPTWLSNGKGPKHSSSAPDYRNSHDISLNDLINLATPRSKSALEKIAEAAAKGRLTDGDLELLNTIAERLTRK